MIMINNAFREYIANVLFFVFYDLIIDSSYIFFDFYILVLIEIQQKKFNMLKIDNLSAYWSMQ